MCYAFYVTDINILVGRSRAVNKQGDSLNISLVIRLILHINIMTVRFYSRILKGMMC